LDLRVPTINSVTLFSGLEDALADIRFARETVLPRNIQCPLRLKHLFLHVRVIVLLAGGDEGVRRVRGIAAWAEGERAS